MSKERLGFGALRGESQYLWERVLVLLCEPALAAAILYGLLLARRKPRGVSNSSERVESSKSKNQRIGRVFVCFWEARCAGFWT